MAKIIYTTYQTNSFKIIKFTFSTYELLHAPVNFPVNLGAFNCFENFRQSRKFPTNCANLTMAGGGGERLPPRPT